MLESPAGRCSEVFLIMLSAEEQMGRDFETSGGVGVSQYNRLMGMASLTGDISSGYCRRGEKGFVDIWEVFQAEGGVMLIRVLRSPPPPRL